MGHGATDLAAAHTSHAPPAPPSAMPTHELPESAAAKRNLRPILDVLQGYLSLEALGLPAALASPMHAPDADDRGPLFLELGCGYGQHAVVYADAFPHLVWQPTDVDSEKLDITNARIAAFEPGTCPGNLRDAVGLDIARRPWRELGLPAVGALAINVIHVAPLDVSQQLFLGARDALASGAALFTYGPYKFNGAFTSSSNADFDRWLKGNDPSWGVREIEVLEMFASGAGFEREEVHEMPANNHLVVWRKSRDVAET